MKVSSRWMFLAGVLGIAMAVLAGTDIALGGQPQTGNQTSPTPPGPRKPMLVQAVDATGHTITVQGGSRDEIREYAFDNFTRVTVNGKSGAISQIQPGMKADLTTASDGKRLTRIDVQDVTPPKTSTTPKAK